jgi:prophage tail gpP-like protein
MGKHGGAKRFEYLLAGRPRGGESSEMSTPLRGEDSSASPPPATPSEEVIENSSNNTKRNAESSSRVRLATGPTANTAGKSAGKSASAESMREAEAEEIPFARTSSVVVHEDDGSIHTDLQRVGTKRGRRELAGDEVMRNGPS